jgi:hypothetical protein
LRKNKTTDLSIERLACPFSGALFAPWLGKGRSNEIETSDPIAARSRWA